MKFFENSFNYDYSFPAVSLAYFLRYPNPYSRHVLTTDVIDRHVDPATKRLHTTRLHLKKSKIPSAMLKILPKGIGGSENSGQSFILETTVVDVNEGWMHTESRNMEWTGILSVVEKQSYRRIDPKDDSPVNAVTSTKPPSSSFLATLPLAGDQKGERTNVRTTVIFKSRLGQAKLRRAQDSNNEEQAPSRFGLLTSWSTSGIQRSIELIGVKRTRDAVLKSKEGMNVVLERLRSGGIVGVLEGMRRDRDLTFTASNGPWKHALIHANEVSASRAYSDDE